MDLLPKATIGEKVVADRVPRLEYTKFPCNRGYSRLKQNLIRIARKRQCQRRRVDGEAIQPSGGSRKLSTNRTVTYSTCASTLPLISSTPIRAINASLRSWNSTANAATLDLAYAFRAD